MVHRLALLMFGKLLNVSQDVTETAPSVAISSSPRVTTWTWRWRYNDLSKRRALLSLRQPLSS